MQVRDQRKRIEKRAYELWERAGRPEGRALEYWVQAEVEIASRKPARARTRDVAAAAAVPRPFLTKKAGPTEKRKSTPAEKKKAPTRK